MNKEDVVYIVFAVDHYNALGIIRGLGEDGIEVNAILIKSKIACAKYSKYITRLNEVNNVEEGYKLLLEKFYNKKKICVVLAGDDLVVSCLDQHFDEISGKFLFFNAGEKGRLSQYMDKKKIGEIAQEAGFIVPKTWEVKKNVIPEDIIYPVITKSESPLSGGWKDDVYVCRDNGELINAYKKIKSNNVVLQQYIKKENELALQGYSINNGREIHISVATNNGYLLPDKYCSYIKVFKFKDSDLKARCRKLLSLIGYNGIFEIEFLVSDETLYFLEVNFRNTAFNYASKYAGENLNKTWPIAMVNSTVVIDHDVDNNTEFMVMAEPQDFGDRVKSKRISMITWFRQLRGCACLFYYNKKDKKPFYLYWKNRIIRKMKI